MGVTVCAVCPSGPVSREIRLARWCHALIINEPNFMAGRWAGGQARSGFRPACNTNGVNRCILSAAAHT